MYLFMGASGGGFHELIGHEASFLSNKNIKNDVMNKVQMLSRDVLDLNSVTNKQQHHFYLISINVPKACSKMLRPSQTSQYADSTEQAINLNTKFRNILMQQKNLNTLETRPFYQLVRNPKDSLLCFYASLYQNH